MKIPLTRISRSFLLILFGIANYAIALEVGDKAPDFNLQSTDGSSYQLMFNGVGLSETSYSDNIVTNGTEYCYRIASVYDDPAGGSVVSEQTIPECGLPISATVYDIIYDDG